MSDLLNLELLENKIVVFGMSCSGKTTFATSVKSHQYYCFDALFHWHLIEAFGLSAIENLKSISERCIADKFILDGWSLADKAGEYLPKGCSVYVIYSDYDHIIDQYRIQVFNREDYREMYKKWYLEVDYLKLPNTKYICNEGVFVQKTRSDYENFLNLNFTS